MLRRIYFLFPDEPHAQHVVDELVSLNVPIRRIHAIAQGVDLKTLPEATLRQKNNTAIKIENFLWTMNLVIFALATMTLVISLITGEFIWTTASLLAMLITFFGGEYFATHVPSVNLDEFIDALSHGEILLMIDVPLYLVTEVEDLVHRRHPEAFGGGVGWSVDAFGI